MRIGLVSSCGGHLTELRALLPAFEGHELFYVLNDQALLPPDMEGRTHFIAHSERDWKFFLNLWEAGCLLWRLRPQVLISTGAGPAVPFALVGRGVFGCKIIYIETIASVERPSLTGRIMYWLAHDFYYQWEGLRAFFPKGRFAGSVL